MRAARRMEQDDAEIDSRLGAEAKPKVDLELGLETQNEIGNRILERLFPEVEPVVIRRFGRYEVSRRLGAGGMSVVFLARDPKLDREVAIKVLQNGDEVLEDQERSLLISEAKAMARLVHPNVVTVFDVGEHEGALFLALERVEGVDLRAWQDGGERRSWRDVVEAYVGAARGLEAAHAAGIIHRDFKPDNVLLGPDGVAKVMDFGLARVSESTKSRVAQSIGPEAISDEELKNAGRMRLSGTPAYMAPERVRGRRGGPASDQFSFCVSLYESLCGRRPFMGESLVTLMTRISTGEREPRPADVDVPVAVWRVVERGLRTDPSARFPSMSALREQLERCLVPPWRRHWVALVGGAVVLSAGVGALAYRSIEPEQCSEAVARIDEIWNDQVRERVSQSMMATGLSYAAATWERVDARVGRYGEQWTVGRRQTCEGRLEDPKAARRADCFEQQLLELQALVEVLATEDPEVVENALDVVAGLSEPARCDDDQWLTSGVPLPVDPMVREQVLALREGFERAWALVNAVKYESALALATEQLEQAEALEHGPSIAEARLLLGTAQDGLGEYEQARTLLLDAFAEATRADAPRLAAKAGVALMEVEGLRRSQHDEGRTWGRLAEGQIARLGDAGARLSADRLFALATIEKDEGNLDEALRLVLEGRVLFEGAVPEDDPRRVEALGDHSSILQARGEYAESIALNREALDRLEQTVGSEHPLVFQHLTVLGIALGRQGRFDEAVQVLGRAKDMSEALFGPDSPSVATALNNLSFVISRNGELDQAIALLERARAIRIAGVGAEHPRVAKIEMNLGIMYIELERYDEATALLEHALKVTEATVGPTNPAVAGILINLSLALLEQDRNREAIVQLERAETLIAEVLGEDHVQMGFVMTNLAIARTSEELYEEAIDAATRGEAVLEAALGPRNPQMIEIVGTHGVALLELGRYGEAEAMLNRALTLAEELKVGGAGEVEIRFGLARVYWALGRESDAKPMAQDARTKAVEHSMPTSSIDQWLAEHP